MPTEGSSFNGSLRRLQSIRNNVYNHSDEREQSVLDVNFTFPISDAERTVAKFIQ